MIWPPFLCFILGEAQQPGNRQICDERKRQSPNRLRPNTARDGHNYGEDDGTLALVEANKKEWTEKARFTLPQKGRLGKSEGKVWTPPVIANGRLYLRDQELLFCFKISEK